MRHFLSTVDYTRAEIERLLDKAAEDIKHTDAPVADKPVEKPVAKSVNKDSHDTAAASQNWQAAHGANLKDVLELWAKKENVQLNWLTMHDFTVKETLSVNSSFEQAVQSLLAQYADEKNKPVSHYYVDTVLKKPVLMVTDQAH